MLVGPGDDASVVQSGGALQVVSVDSFVEDVHFRLREGFSSAAEVGRRAMAGALSDLAAMGARAGEAYVALGIREGIGEATALELMHAAGELAAGAGVQIAGGEVVRAAALSVTITAVGWADSPDRLVLRSGARAGDLVGVTGALGAAGAALALMERGGERTSEAARAVLAAAAAPTPRLREGAALAGAGVHAMIDLSDGLASDAMRVAEQSGVEIEIEMGQLPLPVGVRAVCEGLALDPWQQAASAGEDYELMLCAPRELRGEIERALAEIGEVGLSWVGRVVSEGSPSVRFIDERGERVDVASGYEHRF